MVGRNYGLVTSIEELREYAARCLTATSMGFDCETGFLGPEREKASVHPETAILVGVSFSSSTDWARYVPLAHDRGENLNNYEAAQIFWDLLQIGSGVAHNASFELRHLSKWFRQQLWNDPERQEAVRQTNGYFPIRSDTMIEAYLMAEFERFGLKPLTKALFGHEMTELHELFPDLPKNKRGYLRFNVLDLEPRVVEYACEDSAWCLAIHQRYYDQLQQEPKRQHLYRTEMAIVEEVTWSMEDEGICYDWVLMEIVADELKILRDKYNAEIMADLSELVGQPTAINLGSPQQVSKILFDRLGLRTSVYTKGTRDLPQDQRKMSTSDIALTKIAKNSPVTRKILNWRHMTKLLGSYLEKYETKFNYATDGRVHPSHLTAFVRTGRFAVSEPNYQQCVPGSYEVLTCAGWVRLDKLDDGVEVAQYHGRNAELEWVIPSEVIRAPYTGDMIEIQENESGVWRYTPNHRMPYRLRDRRRKVMGPVKTKTAQAWAADLAAKSNGRIERYHNHAGHIRGGVRLTPQERNDLRLAIAVQADGTATNGHQWDLAVHKHRKVEAFRQMGWAPELQSRGRWRFRVPRQLTSRWLTFSKDFRPSSILTLCHDDLRWFLGEIMEWDGDSTRHATYGQHVRHRDSVDVVQAAAALCGYRTSLYERPQFDAVTVNVHDKDFKSVGAQSATRVPNDDGMVYCVTVPTGMFLVRNDQGKVLVTGNSPKKYHFDLAEATAAHEAGTEPPAGSCFRFNFRDVIVAPPEHYILGFDLSQAELRAIAGEAQETELLEAFENGEDVHRLTAALMLGIAVEDVTDDQRSVGKTLNFAILYGMSVKGLADRLGLTLDEAQVLMDKYFSGLPAIATYIKKQIDFGQTYGYVVSRFGRRLPIWEYKSENKFVRSGGDRACVNYPIQGAATGDYMKMVMVNCMREIRRAGLADKIKLVMNVHDALEFYVHISQRPQDVVALLQPAVVLPVPGWPTMKADWHIGRRWGSPKEMIVHPDGTCVVTDDKVYELRPAVLVDEDGNELEEMPEVDVEALHDAAQPAFGAGRTILLTLTDLPEQERWRTFMGEVTASKGDNRIKVVTPQGEVELQVTSSLRPEHAAKVAALLGDPGLRMEYLADSFEDMTTGLLL